MNSVILVGGFNEIIELCENLGVEIAGIIDTKKDSNPKYPFLGSDDDIERLNTLISRNNLVITPDNPDTREKLHKLYHQHNAFFQTLISAKASIATSAKIGKGTIVQIGVNVSTNVVTGDFVKLNTKCNIMHDCLIGDYTTIAPNAVVLGNVTIGKGCYIGANATILPNIDIADHVVIGAGSVVTKNISQPHSKYAGVPAKRLNS